MDHGTEDRAAGPAALALFYNGRRSSNPRSNTDGRRGLLLSAARLAAGCAAGEFAGSKGRAWRRGDLAGLLDSPHPGLRYALAPLALLMALTASRLSVAGGLHGRWPQASVTVGAGLRVLFGACGVLIIEVNAPQIRYFARRLDESGYLEGKPCAPTAPSVRARRGPTGRGRSSAVGSCSVRVRSRARRHGECCVLTGAFTRTRTPSACARSYSRVSSVAPIVPQGTAAVALFR